MESEKLAKPLAIAIVLITIPAIIYSCSARAGGGGSAFAKGGGGGGGGGGGASSSAGGRGGGPGGYAAPTSIPGGDCSTLPDYLDSGQRCGGR